MLYDSQRKEFIGEIKMKIKIYNTYHQTTEIVEDESIEVAIKNHEDLLRITAENLADNEVEADWKEYYETYEEAWNSTYYSILEQLTSEVEYSLHSEKNL